MTEPVHGAPAAKTTAWSDLVPQTWSRYLDNLALPLPLSFGRPDGGRLLAMGDSWFNYLPHYDVIWWMQAKHGYQCKSVAVIGAELTEMARPVGWDPNDPKAPQTPCGRQLYELTLALRDLDDAQRSQVKAILISGGGNDIAGNRNKLAALLNRAGTTPPINRAAFDQRVNRELRETLVDVLTATVELRRIYLRPEVPIFIHGYAHPVPDGRPGPESNWLHPAFHRQGYSDLQQCTDIMKDLIDGLNDMQRSVLGMLDRVGGAKLFARVHHVDMRGVLVNDLAAQAYKSDWQNELHPTIPRGFEKVADRFAAALTFASAVTGSAPSRPLARGASPSSLPRTRRVPPR